MRIGINCLSINPSYTGGIKTYMVGLLDGFASLDTKAHFNIYANKRNQHLFDRYAKHPNFSVRVVSEYDNLVKRFILWRFAMIRAKRFYRFLADFFYYKISVILSKENDVIYFPNTVINPFNYTRPTVLSMHDIQQVHFPEFFDRDQLKDRYVNYNLSAEHVSFMQASSEFIGQDFLSYFSTLQKQQVEVINEGVDIPQFQEPRDLATVRMKYAIPESYLFFPAQLWLHKNHITVLKALNELHRQGITIPLVLTGAQYSATAQIFDFVKEHKMKYVHYLGKVPFDDLVALYQGARFMITAVLYESSSLPVLEAAAAGTPVIASSTPPNVELSRKLVINLFDPLDVKGLTSLLAQIWNNNELVASQKAANLKNIAYYSWNNIAARYLEFFERIVNNTNQGS